MSTFLGANTMWSLIAQGDLMTKFILLFLFIMSVGSWSIALYKIILFRIKMHQLKEVSIALQDVRDFKYLFEVMKQHAKTLPGYFLSQACSYLKDLLTIRSAGNHNYAQGAGLDFLQMQVAQLTDEIVQEQESYNPILMVTAAVSPLLGLLGTVWGLVHSFIDISQKQSADIVTVAPGIAEALITTIAGLLVAIPALILFYWISHKVKEIESQLFVLSDKIVLVARNLVVEKENVHMGIMNDESLDREM